MSYRHSDDCDDYRRSYLADHPNRSASVEDYPEGTVVLWEASPHGSQFVGRVVAHIDYAGSPALRIVREGGRHGIVYPQMVIGRSDERCACGEISCDYLAFSYPYCRSCGEHHRGQECPVDDQGRSLNPEGKPWTIRPSLPSGS